MYFCPNKMAKFCHYSWQNSQLFNNGFFAKKIGFFAEKIGFCVENIGFFAGFSSGPKKSQCEPFTVGNMGVAVSTSPQSQNGLQKSGRGVVSPGSLVLPLLFLSRGWWSPSRSCQWIKSPLRPCATRPPPTAGTPGLMGVIRVRAEF